MKCFTTFYLFLTLLLPIAVANADAPNDKEFFNSNPDSPFPFSEAVRVDNTYYLSGQIGIVPGTPKLAEGGIEAEAAQTLNNIKATLKANGLGMRDVVKCTVMLADIADWPAFNKVYMTYFEKPYPARSAFASSGLALGAAVEVECIAAK